MEASLWRVMVVLNADAALGWSEGRKKVVKSLGGLSVRFDKPEGNRCALTGLYPHRRPEFQVRAHEFDIEVCVGLKVIPTEHAVVTRNNASDRKASVRPAERRAIAIGAEAGITCRN